MPLTAAQVMDTLLLLLSLSQMIKDCPLPVSMKQRQMQRSQLRPCTCRLAPTPSS